MQTQAKYKHEFKPGKASTCKNKDTFQIQAKQSTNIATNMGRKE